VVVCGAVLVVSCVVCCCSCCVFVCVGPYTILPSPIVYGIYCDDGGSGVTLYCAIVWAMTGRRGVTEQRMWVQIIVLIRAQRPRHKTISG